VLPTNLEWLEVIVTLGGTAGIGETWTLSVDPAGTAAAQSKSFAVTAAARALSKIVTDWAAYFNNRVADGITTHAEATVDIEGNAKIRLWATDASGNRVAFEVGKSIGASGSTVVGGTPKQDFAVIFATQWTMAAFEVKTTTVNPVTGAVTPRILTAEDWVLTITDPATSSTPLQTFVTTYRVKAPSALGAGTTQVGDLTVNLADRAPTGFRPVVSGYQVTFDAPWPAEATSTLVLSGAPVAGTTWTVALDIAGTVKRFSHLVLAGDTLASISESLAARVNADTAGNLSARAAGVALIIVNTAGNTLDTSVSISPTSSALVPDPVTNFAGSAVLVGTPVAGDTWSVTLRHNDGAGPVTSKYDYLVRASVSLAEVATGLVARINAAGSGFAARLNGNTLVIENAAAAGFVASGRVDATGSAGGSVSRSVASPTVTRLTLSGNALLGETWSVTIDGVVYSYTVESLDVIAARLAAAIEAAPGAPYAATSDGTRVLVAHRSASITVITGFTPSSASNGASLAPAAASAWAVRLAGDLAVGETWSIGTGSTSFSTTVLAGDTRSSLARKLADAFNAGAPTGLRAAADGSFLVLADVAGLAFTPQVRVLAAGAGNPGGAMVLEAASGHSRALTGSPVQGEVWVVTITLPKSVVRQSLLGFLAISPANLRIKPGMASNAKLHAMKSLGFSKRVSTQFAKNEPIKTIATILKAPF
jgi:hypothetical protein